MLILVIDTSSERPAIGLSDAGGAIRVAGPSASRRHGRDLVPSIRDLLRARGSTVDDLQIIGVGVGPGSYTGLRIGITAAKVLAYASKAVLVPFDSLEAAAQDAPDEALRVAAVADAQRGDVYAAEFARDAPAKPLAVSIPSRIMSRDAWASQLRAETVVLGPGLTSSGIREAIADGMALDPEPPTPRAERLFALVRRLWAEGTRGDLWSLEPNYLRRSAAEDQWDARSRG